jgi:uncharacterized protein
VALYFFQGSFIFFPPKPDEPWYSKIKSYEYFIKTDSATLHGWKFSNKNINHDASIIYFGGNAEEVGYNIEDAHYYSAKHLFFTNMPGFGSSTGTPSEQSFFSNALQTYDHIIKQNSLNPENVFIMGRSLGSSIATYVASKREAKGLILVTPFDSVENIARNQYKFFPVKLLLKHKFKTEQYIDNVNTPIMFIATDNDGVIPTINLTNLYKPRSQKINLLKINDADHGSISHKEEYFSYINGFILSNSAIEN